MVSTASTATRASLAALSSCPGLQDLRGRGWDPPSSACARQVRAKAEECARKCGRLYALCVREPDARQRGGVLMVCGRDG